KNEEEERDERPNREREALMGHAAREERDHARDAEDNECEHRGDNERQSAHEAPSAPEPRRINGWPWLLLGPPWRARPGTVSPHASRNLYPTPYSVTMYCGSRGSASILRRMFLICVSIARSNASLASAPITSSSCARVKTRPGCLASAA